MCQNNCRSIVLVGVVHQDPLGLPRLQAFLERLCSLNEHKPDFIAVEYDPKSLCHIIDQRPKFRELAEKEWPFLSAEDLTTLENSLGFEGDTHHRIFPDSNTTWLDKGRSDIKFEDVEYYAEDRIKILRDCAKSESRDPNGFLRRLSSKVCAEAKANRKPTGNYRDKQFAEIIKQQLSNYAVVIVGASHVRLDVQNSFASLVQDAGILCRIQILGSS